VTTASAAPTNGQITITADNYYAVWVNGNYVGGYLSGNSSPFTWGAPSTYSNVDWVSGTNTVVIEAQNAGDWNSGNPAGLLAKFTDGSTLIGTTSATGWMCNSINVPAEGIWAYPTGLTFTQPVTSIAAWNNSGTIWAGAESTYGLTGNFTNAFSGTTADWIWSGGDIANDTPQDNVVYFENTFDAPAVPEPTSILLGVMGLGSLAGLRRFRKA
jgi:hypothetical protein